MALANSGRAIPRGVIEQEPVREFMGDHRRLATSLLASLQAERENAAATIVKGGPRDYAEYRHRVGVIEGLDLAIAYCKDAQDRL